MWIRRAVLFALLAAACGTPERERPSQASSPVVYGVDDRKDYFEELDPVWRDLTRNSIVALATPDELDETDPNNVVLDSSTLGEAERLCNGERFADQPTLSECSGTLIDDDLVLTAGHCARNSTDCRGYRFVFNYRMEADGQLATLTHEDLFDCRAVVAWRMSNRPTVDFAIVQLDRPATPRFTPAPVRRDVAPLAGGSPLTLISFGSGLPAKIDHGGRVLDARGSTMDYFTGTMDSFGGSSGGGVFDERGQVVGILVRGERDYVRRGSCFVVNDLANDGRSGDEEATYVHNAIQLLCFRGIASSRLCGANGASCGDGRCELPESATTCPADCPLVGGADGGTSMVAQRDGGLATDGGLGLDAGAAPNGGLAVDAGPVGHPDGPYLPADSFAYTPTPPETPLIVGRPAGGCGVASQRLTADGPLTHLPWLAVMLALSAWAARRRRGPLAACGP